jgi:hypothetical protein
MKKEVRLHTTLIGSKAITGTLTKEDLKKEDSEGISIKTAC